MGTIRWHVGEEIHLDRITNFDAEDFLKAHPDLPTEVKIGEGRHIGEATDKARMLNDRFVNSKNCSGKVEQIAKKLKELEWL